LKTSGTSGNNQRKWMAFSRLWECWRLCAHRCMRKLYPLHYITCTILLLALFISSGRLPDIASCYLFRKQTPPAIVQAGIYHTNRVKLCAVILLISSAARVQIVLRRDTHGARVSSYSRTPTSSSRYHQGECTVIMFRPAGHWYARTGRKARVIMINTYSILRVLYACNACCLSFVTATSS
jgi:hypothetical protein